MTSQVLSNKEYLESIVGGVEIPGALLPHEVDLVQLAIRGIQERTDENIRNKQEVTGGDDWHDGAFRATDNQAKILAANYEAVAPFTSPTVVAYPDETEDKVSLGSRVYIDTGRFQYAVDVVGFRLGYPDDVIDEPTGEEVSAVSTDSPLTAAIIGKAAGETAEYRQGDRSLRVKIERINQTAISEYFLNAAGVEAPKEDA